MSNFKKTGYALRNQNCELCGRRFSFVQGEAYEIDHPEIWAKLTNSRQPVLRPEARKHIPEPGEPVKKEYNKATDKLRGKGKKK